MRVWVRVKGRERERGKWIKKRNQIEVQSDCCIPVWQSPFRNCIENGKRRNAFCPTNWQLQMRMKFVSILFDTMFKIWLHEATTTPMNDNEKNVSSSTKYSIHLSHFWFFVLTCSTSWTNILCTHLGKRMKHETWKKYVVIVISV